MALARLTPIDEFFSPFFSGALVPEFRELSNALSTTGVQGSNVGRLIAIDFSEKEDAYSLKADLPGLRKEDIHVSVEK